MGRFAKLVACVTALALLGACDAPVTDTSVRSEPAASASAGPGPQPATRNIAIAFFKDVCVATAPTFAGAPAVLASKQVVQNATTTTYYHQQYDMSVQLNAKGCSFVAGGNFKASDLAALTATHPNVRPRALSNFRQRTYISALLPKGARPLAFQATILPAHDIASLSLGRDVHRLVRAMQGSLPSK